MNREEVIEKAAEAILRTHEPGYANARGSKLRGVLLEQFRECAVAVLDELLPQVTTVEELQALPVRTVIVHRDGDACRKRWNGLWELIDWPPLTASDLIGFGPFTVVYRP